MSILQTFNGATLSDVSSNGHNYLYSLINDYETYIEDFGFISIDEFIQGWTCIPLSGFARLAPGNEFYSPVGIKYTASSKPWESDDETYYYIECTSENIHSSNYSPFGNEEILSSGDIYYKPYIHFDYEWKKKILKRKEDKPCPILIMKTNQHPN